MCSGYIQQTCGGGRVGSEQLPRDSSAEQACESYPEYALMLSNRPHVRLEILLSSCKKAFDHKRRVTYAPDIYTVELKLKVMTFN